MDGIVDGIHGRFWYCRKDSNHAVGLMHKKEKDGAMVNQLLVFRAAVAVEEADKPLTLDDVVMLTAIGLTVDIECDICKTKRTWYPDKKLAVDLISQLYAKGANNE